jgi:hypothetical protein
MRLRLPQGFATFLITAALTAMGQPCPELDMVYFLLSEQAPNA